jgi:hypothetical protein
VPKTLLVFRLRLRPHTLALASLKQQQAGNESNQTCSGA